MVQEVTSYSIVLPAVSYVCVYVCMPVGYITNCWRVFAIIPVGVASSFGAVATDAPGVEGNWAR